MDWDFFNCVPVKWSNGKGFYQGTDRYYKRVILQVNIVTAMIYDNIKGFECYYETYIYVLRYDIPTNLVLCRSHGPNSCSKKEDTIARYDLRKNIAYKARLSFPRTSLRLSLYTKFIFGFFI